MPRSHGPAKRPCASCPYRRDCPSGLWHESEYAKLEIYDQPFHGHPTQFKPFYCHQNNGRLCAGWCAVHGDGDNVALRIAVSNDVLTVEEYRAAVDYVSPTPTFTSGAEAAQHGLAEVAAPGSRARRKINQLIAQRERRERQQGGNT